MRLDNLPDDVQAESQAISGFRCFRSSQAPPQWIKDGFQLGRFNREPMVSNFENELRTVSLHHDLYWRLFLPVFDRVLYQVAKHLPQTHTIPHALTVSCDFQLQSALRICSPQQIEFIGDHECRVQGGGPNVDAHAKFGAIVIAQIVEERLHAGPASYQTSGGVRHLISGVEL